MTGMELCFTNGLEDAAYYCANGNSGKPKHEIIWDASKQIKKISVSLTSHPYVYGIQFLDEKDNELVKHVGSNGGDW